MRAGCEETTATESKGNPNTKTIPSANSSQQGCLVQKLSCLNFKGFPSPVFLKSKIIQVSKLS